MSDSGDRPVANLFQTAEQYRRLRTKLVVYFEGRRCWHADDLADEAIARLITYASTSEFDGNADALAFGIARNVLKEWYRKNAPQADVENQDRLPASSLPHPDAESAARAARTLATLPPEDRDLLEEYYIDGATAVEMADRWKLTPAGVRTRIFRLRARLAKFLARESPD